MYLRKILQFLCLSIFCFSTISLLGQGQSVDLFSSRDPLKITLTFDVKQLLKGKYKDKYIPADLQVEPEPGQIISESIKIRARGNSRRTYCHLPPIKLNFKDDETKESKFMGQTTLKLVSPCKSNKSFQQYVYIEYLAYQMFNTISDISFKVRLVEFTYIDSRGKRAPYEAYGFIIEHIDHLAKRNTSREIELAKFSQKLVNKDYMAKVAVFQYAIGNTDWLVANLHNVKLIQLNDIFRQEVYAVPYDFDYAGLVNAIYAVPHEDLGLESVRERLFRGLCYSSEELRDVFQLFKDRKGEIISLIETFSLLEDRQRYAMMKYIEEFYQIIDNPISVKNNIQGFCAN